MSSSEHHNTLLDPDLTQQMIEIRRHLHRNPELSNDEWMTQAYLKEQLLQKGFAVVREVAGYGLAIDIVGTAGPSGRKLIIRADIDALPIEEESGVVFRSENPGVMHACGHDAHAAMAFAVAVLLDRQKALFEGTVRIIFQPAEEAEPLGGRRVVEEGLLDDIDAAIGIHVDPYTETGKIGVATGPYSLASDIFDISITGVSAHAAKPSEGVDAIAVASSIVSEVQKIVSREIDPYDPLVISITSIEGGTGAYNVIADRAKLRGTIRSGQEETRQKAWSRLTEIAAGVAKIHSAKAEVTLQRGEPAVINDTAMVEIVRKSGIDLLGQENTLNLPGWTASDDFAFYSEKCRSVYFRLGIRDEQADSVYPLHHPKFRVDERALAIGANMLYLAAREFLETGLQ
ncbi:M20 metallopeptidase family protein [Brucella intermedia]|uniref:M20 metallopeptidase family protein n=1 Tax=Brucella intermedia TaxID=94625 RepID=UPI002248E0B3|nr:amidohydrolase [Brucella intermedia]